MAFITLNEIFDLVIMTLVVGFIFKGMFRTPATEITNKYDDFKIAVILTAPAIILHEMAHKFTALVLGVQATFHAAYMWLGIGVLLKLISPGFIFFVPGYVSHQVAITPLQLTLIAFAGPFLNLVLWLGSSAVLKYNKSVPLRTEYILIATKRINMFLFFFNMIPLGFFDGARVLQGLIGLFS